MILKNIWLFPIAYCDAAKLWQFSRRLGRLEIRQQLETRQQIKQQHLGKWEGWK